MNFDTYKIKDELLEIYSGSEETFCVGKILSQNRDSILFRSYDAQGKNDGLHFIKSSHISEIKSIGVVEAAGSNPVTQTS